MIWSFELSIFDLAKPSMKWSAHTTFVFSDLFLYIVMVVDSEDPLFYRCSDLVVYDVNFGWWKD
jgi:hypothetical protein